MSSRSLVDVFIPVAATPFTPPVRVSGRPLTAFPAQSGRDVGVSLWLEYDPMLAEPGEWEIFVHPADAYSPMREMPVDAQWIATAAGSVVTIDLAEIYIAAHVLGRPVTS